MFCLGKVWLVIKPIGLESLRLLSSLPILAGPPGTFYEKRPFLQLWKKWGSLLKKYDFAYIVVVVTGAQNATANNPTEHNKNMYSDIKSKHAAYI